jgi:uncharacterized protein (DUF433 family)
MTKIERAQLRRAIARWKPKPLRFGVTLSPWHGFGQACVSTSLACRHISSRFIAGDSIEVLAEDYDLPTATVTNALRYMLLPASTRRRLERAALAACVADWPEYFRIENGQLVGTERYSEFLQA